MAQCRVKHMGFAEGRGHPKRGEPRMKCCGLPVTIGLTIIATFLFMHIPGATVWADGDGNLLKRSEEETCQACHKTDSNSPSDPDAIKTHNSVNTGSTKWGGSWGVAGGKYGAIVCTTCHTAHDTSNIYLIRGTITTPDGSNFSWGSTNSVSVDFRSKSGSAGQAGTMGDDTVSHDPSSRICEVCHSQNKYHNSNKASNVDNTHNNGMECSGCHSHKQSFKIIQCATCHGVPPTAGGQKHATHFGTGTATYGSTTIQSTSTAYSFNCGTCHSGTHSITSPSNPHTVTINFAGLATQDGATGAAYTPPSTYSVDSPAGSAYTFNYGDGTCSNIYCHGNYPGSGKNTSPTFLGTAPCGSCHEATNTTVPASGSHSKHAGSSYYSFPCTRCHYGIVGGSGPASYTIADRSKHVNGYIDWSFDTFASTSAAYSIPSGTAMPSDGTSRAYGTCSNTYCHSNGTSVATGTIPANTSAVWGTGPLACSSCHSYPPSYGNNSPKANSHVFHSSKGYTCDKCHYGTTTNGTSITGYGSHVNGAYDLQAGSGISFTYTYNSGGGTCSNISCHGGTNAQWGKTECLDCHSVSQGNRAAITPQFSGNSHHIQGVTVTNDKCYQCHWEANSDGTINTTYHGGSANPGAPVQLVIYGNGARPTTYTLGATAVAYTANGSRTEIQKINQVCLGCHNETNKTITPFGDGKTPAQYSWDGYSIDAKYSSTSTTPWGKYSGANVTPKNARTKAFSAHGNAANDQGGWDLNETWPNTRGTVNVLCFDCHNSHGSTANGTTTSYTSATTNGGILKSTTANKGGYTMTYAPASGGSTTNKDAYNAGAGLCFDCHLTQNSGTTPWGYQSTYGSTQAIIGYWDTPYFAPGTFPSQSRYGYKSGTGNQGGHFGASSTLTSTPSGTINGLCTPCHDPHGVSPTFGANMQYGVPLLKGTFLTSPYKEDVAPAGNTAGTAPLAGASFHIDQNTFGTNISNAVPNYISEPDTVFAGLCLKCHAKSSLTNGTTHTWKDKNRIHESVKGWKTANSTIQHQYVCSKCHTVHNSRLPRLMVTNCLNSAHKGRVGNNSSPKISGSGSGTQTCLNAYSPSLTCSGDGASVYCYEKGLYSGMGCGGVGGSGSGRMPGNYSYSSVDIGNGSNAISCHETDTGSVTDQSWNTKTPWTN